MKLKRMFQLFLIIPVVLISMVSEVYPQGMKVPRSQVTQPSSHSFDETVGILKDAIESENLMVIKEINVQQMLRMVGVRTKGMKQILFFHPRYMKKIFQKNKNAGIEPPMKILVMERLAGKAKVKYIKPTYLLGKYKGLESVAKELEELVQKIVAQVK